MFIFLYLNFFDFLQCVLVDLAEPSSQSSQQPSSEAMLSPIVPTSVLSRSQSSGNAGIPPHLQQGSTVATPARQNLGGALAAAAQPSLAVPNVSQHQQSQPLAPPPSQPVVTSAHLNQRPVKAGMYTRLYIVA